MRRVSGPENVNPVPNISSFSVGGGAAGMIVTAAFVVIGLIGLPSARWFLAGSLILGGIMALALRYRARG
jgi:hypothetical protein